MTVVNPKSISGITSITTASGSDNLLTIHTSDVNNTERLRIDSTGTTKIVTGIVTTLTATTGIVTTLTTNTLTANSTTKVGSGVTLSPDGHSFIAGVSTTGTLSVSGIVTSTGDVDPITGTITSSGDITVGGDLTLESVTPAIKLTDSNQETDNKTFMISGSATKKLRIQALNDAGGGGGELFEFVRDGNNVRQFQGAKSAVPWFVVNNNTKKVGIGTTIPAADLHVSSGSNTEIRIGDTSTTPAYAKIVYNNNADSSDALIIGVDGDNDISASNIRFQVDGDEKARILSTGGITFNGDTAAANALNDYEEGTITFAPVNTGVSFDSNYKGRYTKIGELVTVSGYLVVSSLTQSGNTLNVQLPFTSAANGQGYYSRGVGATFARNMNFPSNYHNMVAYVGGAEAYIRFFMTRNAGGSADWYQMTHNNITSNTSIFFNVCYTVVT